MSDELDRILSARDEIIPSCGFVDAVMDVVRHEAAAPPPIPFPWKRALPGLAVAAVALVSLVVEAVQSFSPATAPVGRVPLDSWANILGAEKLLDAGWVALALVLSFVSIRLSMHFAERGTLKSQL
jgi:hypothetical protein